MFKKAIPVWAKEYVDERNILLEFAKNVKFDGKFIKLTLAADALYRLYVNGELVSHGPQRAGKGFWRVDEIDLTHVLKREAENELKIQVLTHGIKSFEYVVQPAFLMAEIEMDGNVIAATGFDGDFSVRRILSKVQKVERYSYQRPFLDVWQLPVEYSDELETVKVEGINVKPRTAPYPNLEVIPFDMLVSKGEASFKSEVKVDAPQKWNTLENFSYDVNGFDVYYNEAIATIGTAHKEDVDKKVENYSFILEENEFEMFKLPYDNTGFIKCTIEAPHDATVYFLYDDVLRDGDILQYGTSGIARVVPVYLKGGKHSFIGIEPYTMQYLKVLCVKGSVKISGLSLVQYVNSRSHVASFESDDEAINRIYEAAVHTFEQNAVDIFMDCPHRERAGWLCDSFFTARVEKDLTGASGVEKGFLENFFYATDFNDIPDGMLPMCYPAVEATHNFIPNWAMFLVIELEEYVQRTGDYGIIDAAKERLYRLEDYFCEFINEDGLLEKLKGWVFVEWSQANKWVQDVNFPSNMMYYAMLKSMARMYGDEALDKKAEKIKETIIKLSYNGKFFRDHQIYDENGKKYTPEDVTEVCQYYAFFTGIAEKSKYPELLEIIANDFGAGHKCEKTQPGVYPANAFIGNYLRMEVLAENGYRKQIINEIRDYFDYMAKLTGTLWENDRVGSSCNHGFASHVVRLIFRDCLGIDGVDEINKKIYLNNDYTSPEHVKAVLPLLNGSIKVTVEGGARKVEISGDYKIG